MLMQASRKPPPCNPQARYVRGTSHAKAISKPAESKAQAGEAACFWDIDPSLSTSAGAQRLIVRDVSAGILLGGMVGLVGEHPLFGAAAATAFLAANLLDAVALGGDVAVLERFNLVE